MCDAFVASPEQRKKENGFSVLAAVVATRWFCVLYSVLCCAVLVLSLAWVDTDTDTVRIDRSILIEIENDSMTMIGSLVSMLSAIFQTTILSAMVLLFFSLAGEIFYF